MVNKFIIIGLVLFISCYHKVDKTTHEKKDRLELSIINDTVYYCAAKDTFGIMTTPFYYSDSELLDATNSLTFKVKNNSNKKIMLVLNSVKVDWAMYSDFLRLALNEKYANTFLLELKNRKGKSPMVYTFLNRDFDFDKKERIDSIYLAKSKEALLEKGYKKNFEFSDIIDKGMLYINPHDSILISRKLTLPIVKELIPENELQFGFIMHKDSSYTFNANYASKASLIEENLPKRILDSLKSENIEIFDGVLTSNRVPVAHR